MSVRIREINNGPHRESDDAKSGRSERPISQELPEINAFSQRKEKYFQLERNTLLENTIVNFSIFRKKSSLFELIVRADSRFPATLDQAKITKIQDGRFEVLIESVATPQYRAYLESILRQPCPAEDVLRTMRATFLKESSKILMKELLDNPDSAEKIKEIKPVVAAIIDSLFDNTDMIRNMLSLSRFDYYTYTHSVDVAILSIGLGIAIGLSKYDILNLGIGAMLHDIGKSAITQVLLNKQGKLDDLEYRLIQRHVQEGLQILKRHKAIPAASFNAVGQHHEKLSGKGYPLGLKGDEIDLFGRITGIADCYDALTTDRIYKRAIKPFDALHHISKEREDYDKDLLQAFVKMLGKVKPTA